MSSVLVAPNRSPAGLLAERRSREASRPRIALSSRVYLAAVGMAALAAVLVGLDLVQSLGWPTFHGIPDKTSGGPRKPIDPWDQRGLSHRCAKLVGTAAAGNRDRWARSSLRQRWLERFRRGEHTMRSGSDGFWGRAPT
jgi:hypothetical protein